MSQGCRSLEGDNLMKLSGDCHEQKTKFLTWLLNNPG